MRKMPVILAISLTAAALLLTACLKGGKDNGPADPGTEILTDDGGGASGEEFMNAEPLALDRLELMTYGSTAQNDIYRVEKTADGVRVGRYLTQWEDGKEVENPVRVLELGAEDYDRIARMLSYYQVENWDGFAGNNSHVLDGGGFNFEMKLTDGSSVNAHGSNSYPDHYGQIRDAILAYLKGGTLTDAAFSFGNYRLTLPDSWVGCVDAIYYPDSVVFTIDPDGAAILLLRIDTQSYGYTSGDSDTYLRTGRLVSGEDETFVTFCLYKNTHSGQTLTEEQQALLEAREADAAAMAESISGSAGYEFIPEDGLTLYETDADQYFETAKKLWLSLYLAGEYPSSRKTLEQGGKRYMTLQLTYDRPVYKTVQDLKNAMYQSFDKTYADSLIDALTAKGDLLEQDGCLWVAAAKQGNVGSYGGYFVSSITQEDETHAVVNMKVNKAGPDDEKYRYSQEETVLFPMVKTGEGLWVFTDYPYWGKAES